MMAVYAVSKAPRWVRQLNVGETSSSCCRNQVTIRLQIFQIWERRVIWRKFPPTLGMGCMMALFDLVGQGPIKTKPKSRFMSWWGPNALSQSSAEYEQGFHLDQERTDQEFLHGSLDDFVRAIEEDSFGLLFTWVVIVHCSEGRVFVTYQSRMIRRRERQTGWRAVLR